MRLRIVIPTVLILALAGCAGDGPPPEAASPAPPAAGDGPIALIGNWTVAGTDEEAGTVLRIAPKKQLSLWRSCGVLTGSWAAVRDVFLAELNGGSGKCVPAGDTTPAKITPAWLVNATAYGISGTDLVLVDRSGKELARLAPGGKPKVGEDVAASEAEPPVISDEDRAELTQAPQLAAGLTPVEPNLVVGRWVPVSGGGEAFAEFSADGTWKGSDGCNGNGGRWAANASAMLATGGLSTLIACDGAPVPGWVTTTAVAGLDNGVLVLLDGKGAEVARLKKG